MEYSATYLWKCLVSSLLEQFLPIPEQEYLGFADYHLALLAPLFGELIKIDEPQGLYRVHGENTTSKSLDKLINEITSKYEFTSNMVKSHIHKSELNLDDLNWPQTWF